MDYTISKERIDEAVKLLIEIQKDSDTEQAHIDADDVLLNLLPREVQKEFMDLHKWYA